MNISKKAIATTTLGVVCFVLTMAIAIQIKTTNNLNSAAAQTLEENELRDQVLRTKEKYDNAYADLQEAIKRLEEVRINATKDDTESQEKQKEIKLNNMLLCQTDVTGNGVTITLKDGSKNSSDILSSIVPDNSIIVHQSDLWAIVNDLKNAGAEAIAINGERIVPTSSITCEGIIIKINNKKIGAPYVIEAIGPQTVLYTSLTIPNGYLDTMISDGVSVDIKRTDDITIEKYDGVITTSYMENDN